MLWVLIIPKKPPFGSILGHFWHKNLKTRFSSKKFDQVSSKPKCYCNIMQKIRRKPWISIFQGFLCSTNNYGTLWEGQSNSLDVNHCISTISTWRSLGALQWGWVPKPSQTPSAIWDKNLLILIAMPYSTRFTLSYFT